MRFPDNTTIDEMKYLLIQLWQEYIPESNHSFLLSLNEEWCNLVLDLVTTKDESKRNEIWGKVETMIVQWKKDIDTILHEAHQIMLSFREKIWKEQDENDVIDLENILQNI